MPISAGQNGVASDFINESAGSGDEGKVPKLNASGKLDQSFLDENSLIYQVADSPATWTKPANLAYIKVRLWGGGGSGARELSTGECASGAGGGAGAEKIILASTLGANVTVTIGAGGPAKSGAGRIDGDAGGNSSFGSHLICSGGGAGVTSNNNAVGGAGGAVNAMSAFSGVGGTSGGGGGNGVVSAGGGGSTDAGPTTGAGGSSVMGGAGGGGSRAGLSGAGGISADAGNGGAGAATGVNAGNGVFPAGGGGATNGVSATSGAGANGLCIVTQFYN